MTGRDEIELDIDVHKEAVLVLHRRKYSESVRLLQIQGRDRAPKEDHSAVSSVAKRQRSVSNVS